jgi:N-acetylneuraminate synthase
MASIDLGGYKVSSSSFPYIIAEIGVNHEGSLERAEELIRLAKEGGAHAAKFQTYKAETLASRHSPSYWDLKKEPTTSQYELFKKYDKFGPAEYIHLAKYCKDIGIEFLSTPFDEKSIDFLDPLMSFYKIASADIMNVPFLRKIASKKKFVVLSTGASTLEEVDYAIQVLQNAGCKDICLLHCVLNYPTENENANLNMISCLLDRYPEFVIGYSDHTLPDSEMSVLTAAYLKGARVIEKHFTFDKTLPGNDHYHAMDVDDLKVFVRRVKQLQKIEGNTFKTPLKTELISRKNARRSIVLSEKVTEGTVLKENMLTYKRPGMGINTIHWDKIIGMKTKVDLDEDHVLCWDDLDLGLKNSKERVICVIQARMGSSRFPGKMMEKLAGITLIEWILRRVSTSEKLDQIILATSENKQNDQLAALATKMGISVIRGDENDVLSRFHQAAEKYSADIIVRVCGDNPFIDGKEIDRLVEYFLENRPDYAFNHINKMCNNYADGFGAEIFTRGVLEDLNTLCTSAKHREHVTLYLWDNPYSYRIETFSPPPGLAFGHLRFDIDFPEDLKSLEPIAKQVGIEGNAADFVEFMLRSNFDVSRNNKTR